MKELFTQLQTFLEDKNNILIVSHRNMDGDGLASMLVMKKYLEKMQKQVSAVYYDEQIPELYQFLPYVNEVETSVKSSKDFIISFKLDGTEIENLKHSIDLDTLNITITPKSPNFEPKDIITKKAAGKYDAIIVLDSGDFEHLGLFYEKNTELFFSTPVINIDHHLSNTGFGQLNIVDSTAASTTQIIYEIIQELEKDPKTFINEEIATLLLTGLTVDTGSFQHTNTTPKALETAANLVELGARQQEIIQHIYKTKKLSTLKLWGKILSKIEEDPIHKIVWSTITKEDLKETQAETDAEEGLIDELMTNAPGTEIVALFKESTNNIVSASLRSTSTAVDTLPISTHFGGGGHKMASGFKQKGKNFNLFIAEVINFMNKYQEKRLNLTEEEIEKLKQTEEKITEKKEDISNEKKTEQKSNQKIDIISKLKTSNKEPLQTRPKPTPKTQIKPQERPIKTTTPSFQEKPKPEKKPIIQAKPQQTTPPLKAEPPQTEQKIIKKDTPKPITKKPQEKTPETATKARPTQDKIVKKETTPTKPLHKPTVKPTNNKPEPQKQFKQNTPIQKKQVTKTSPQTTKPQQNNIPKKTEPPKQKPTTTQTKPPKQITPQAKKPEQKQSPTPQTKQQPQQTQPVQAQTQATPQTQQSQQQITKAQAQQYANTYATQLQTINQQTPEYAQIYDYYQYYNNLAQQLTS